MTLGSWSIQCLFTLMVGQGVGKGEGSKRNHSSRTVTPLRMARSRVEPTSGTISELLTTSGSSPDTEGGCSPDDEPTVCPLRANMSSIGGRASISASFFLRPVSEVKL